MMTYAISLKRATERRQYIENHLTQRGLSHKVIDAVDGRLMTDDERAALCNIDRVKAHPRWLTPGAIGCALSHQLAYKAFLAGTERHAFIVEDDAHLPEDIAALLIDIAAVAADDEVVLLYATSLVSGKLSTHNALPLRRGRLHYPLDLRHAMTATAYVVGRSAANGLLNANTPVASCADAWHHFYDRGGFKTLRVHYPIEVRTMPFKSSIDYLQDGSLSQRFSAWVDRHKVFPFYRLLARRRAVRARSMMRYRLVDAPSQYDI